LDIRRLPAEICALFVFSAFSLRADASKPCRHHCENFDTQGGRQCYNEISLLVRFSIGVSLRHLRIQKITTD
jgi:hypothetical protein